MPSVLVMPTRAPVAASRWAIRRTVVVLPLVPVTATTGMRPSSPSPNMVEMMASPTGRPLPYEGARCMRRPGAALTSTTAPSCSSSGRETVRQTTSTPQMSRPTVCAASTARAAHSGWTSSVTSVALPPVLRLALLRSITRAPAGGTQSAVSPCMARRVAATSSRRMRVSEVEWPSPRRGSRFSSSTSSRTVRTPSPVTCGGSRRAAATSCPPTTRARKSSPAT